uniref:Uncharacterized protein n=1 Tax=Ditylenchus dipsaci TaxID=166011 RepID=A0A915DXT7_9BILA
MGLSTQNSAIPEEIPNRFASFISGSKVQKVTNCHWRNTTIFHSALWQGIISPLGDTSYCQLKDGRCQLADGSLIIWTPKHFDNRQCQYLKVATWEGVVTQQAWMANNVDFALTFASKTPFVVDCNMTLALSEQGYGVRAEQRQKREDKTWSYVSPEQLAAQITAAQVTSRNVTKAVHNAMAFNFCKTLGDLPPSNDHTSSATARAQKMLEEKAITADWVTSDIIEVWPCIPIPDRMIHGRATPKCYNTVPVTLYSQIQLDAFLDPKTEELKSTGEEVECRSLYYRLDSTLHRYDQPNGVHTVVEESAVKEMQDGKKTSLTTSRSEHFVP